MSQAKKVYAFEDTFMKAAQHAKAPLHVLQSLADAACRRWRVPPVDVKFATGPNWSGMYYPELDKIALFVSPKKDRGTKKALRSGRNPAVLLHEVAHHIDDWKVNEDAEDAHGASFLAICMDLYDHYNVLPKAAFKLLTKKAGLKIAPRVRPGMRKRASAKRRRR